VQAMLSLANPDPSSPNECPCVTAHFALLLLRGGTNSRLLHDHYDVAAMLERDEFRVRNSRGRELGIVIKL
jgi:hypothetical protein